VARGLIWSPAFQLEGDLTVESVSGRTPSFLLRSGPQRLVLTDLLHAIRSCRSDSYALWDHSIAVAARSRHLAAAMGLRREDRRLAYLGGLLHDVGKSAVCHATLFKAGPLDDSERLHLQEHPRLGAELVVDLGAPAVHDAVSCHHELFDGTGYPFGLSGRQTPLIARIVGVADYYEALRESRPYRPNARSHVEAMTIIGTLAHGGKLDPGICSTLAATVGFQVEPVKLFARFSMIFEYAA